MWARHLELALGCWLGLAPFVFRHPPEARALWLNDLACGALLVVLPLLSHWKPLRRIHLWELPIALWLVIHGRFLALDLAPAAAQNQIMVGLVIAMFAIVPSDAMRPPQAWRTRMRVGADASGSGPRPPF